MRVLVCGAVSSQLCSLGTDKYCSACLSDRCRLCNYRYPNITGSCTQPTIVISNCKYYLTENACESCDDGYYLSENTCKPLTANCAVGSNTGYCIYCSPGYIIENNVCVKGTCTITNCTQCGRSKCGYCASGSVLVNETSCVPAVGNYVNCMFVYPTVDRCGICNDGYYMSSIFTCIAFSDSSKSDNIFAILFAFLLGVLALS